MNHFQEFEKVVKEMEIPDNRKTANEPNALWFIRAGCALVKDHEKVMTAIFHARQICN
jgi:hypothetical protein